MIKADNEDKSLDKGMLDTVQSLLIFALILILIAFIREFLGTGGLAFGYYLNINFTVNVFSKYAISVLLNPFGGLIVLGFILAVINSKGVSK